MKVAIASLQSISPYSASRAYERDVEHETKESHDAYEKRTWRHRLHTTEKGLVFIPPMSFKIALATSARFLSMKIPGRRNATYTKHFEAGVLVTEGPVLPVKAADVPGEWLYLNADGRRGSGTRVWRCMPKIEDWKAEVKFYILDETIDAAVFEQHLREAGNFVGIGRFRPERGGFYGRFKVTGIRWQEVTHEVGDEQREAVQ